MYISNHGFFENPYDTRTEALHAVDAHHQRLTKRYLKEPQPQRPRLERLSDIERVLDLLVEQHI